MDFHELIKNDLKNLIYAQILVMHQFSSSEQAAASASYHMPNWVLANSKGFLGVWICFV